MENNEYKELVQRARKVDLLGYLKSSGYTISPHGQQFYVKEFPGLCVKPENNSWYHFYTNQGSTNNSIDCLTNVIGHSFKQAVYELTGQDFKSSNANNFSKEQAPDYKYPPKTKAPERAKKELKMPEQAENMRQLFAYFCKTRKIPSQIVEEMVRSGLLYQSQNIVNTTINGIPQTFKNANAVFIHKNEKGQAVGGEIQGLNSFKRYKGMVSGTGESAFTFTPFPTSDGKPKRAYIFESAIDLMSFYTFCDKKKLNGAMFVSMGGLKPVIPKKLEADGVQIVSCVDNDDAGRRFEAENNFIRSAGVKHELDEKGFKDWNELLVFKSENPDANLLENNGNQMSHGEEITRNNTRRK